MSIEKLLEDVFGLEGYSSLFMKELEGRKIEDVMEEIFSSRFHSLEPKEELLIRVLYKIGAPPNAPKWTKKEPLSAWAEKIKEKALKRLRHPGSAMKLAPFVRAAEEASFKGWKQSLKKEDAMPC